MAHGTSRINICWDCNHYTEVNRFSPDPNCPKCGKKTKQTNKEELKIKYQLGFFYNFRLNFNHWQPIKMYER